MFLLISPYCILSENYIIRFKGSQNMCSLLTISMQHSHTDITDVPNFNSENIESFSPEFSPIFEQSEFATTSPAESSICRTDLYTPSSDCIGMYCNAVTNQAISDPQLPGNTWGSLDSFGSNFQSSSSSHQSSYMTGSSSPLDILEDATGLQFSPNVDLNPQVSEPLSMSYDRDSRFKSMLEPSFNSEFQSPAVSCIKNSPVEVTSANYYWNNDTQNNDCSSSSLSAASGQIGNNTNTYLGRFPKQTNDRFSNHPTSYSGKVEIGNTLQFDFNYRPLTEPLTCNLFATKSSLPQQQTPANSFNYQTMQNRNMNSAVPYGSTNQIQSPNYLPHNKIQQIHRSFIGEQIQRQSNDSGDLFQRNVSNYRQEQFQPQLSHFNVQTWPHHRPRPYPAPIAGHGQYGRQYPSTNQVSLLLSKL